MRISLFITCFNDTVRPETGRAVVDIVEALGHEVEFPAAQTCCGQMHLNSGYPREAARLARRFVRVFEHSELIVSPSASCVAMVRENYPRLLGAAAEPVSARVVELTEFLARHREAPLQHRRFEHSVYYHPTCHSLRSLGIGDAPCELLAAVPGVRLDPARAADRCCGFGGTFSVKNPAVSTAMMDRTLEQVESSGADVLTAVDNSCLMHLQGGLKRRGSSIRVMHLAEIVRP